MNPGNRGALLLAAAGIGALAATRAIVRRRRVFNVRGKAILITGGSRGLGLVLARELAAMGARLALCARDDHELESARRELALGGAEVLTVTCDVTDQEQVRELVRTVGSRLGGVDVLINNAGVIEVGPLEVMTLGDFEEAMKTHFWAPLYTTLAVVPGMRSRGGGRIVNISSIGGKIAVPHLVPYSASKFALVGLSKGLRSELMKDGIVVTTVCPGLMRTGSPRNATFKGKHRAEYAWFSIGDSLPVTSMSAERAARQIVSAFVRGDAEVVLSIQAQIAVTFDALFPELSADLLAVVNALLPGPGGIGKGYAKGKDSQSRVSPSVLTALGDAAALQNNEVS